MLCVKRFRSAATTISGIELMRRIRKGPFNLATLDLKDTTTPAVFLRVSGSRGITAARTPSLPLPDLSSAIARCPLLIASHSQA
jgi:hypothetical protein